MSQHDLEPAIDLHAIDQVSRQWDAEPAEAFSLPPTDHGRQAYLFLAACVMLEAICWGFPAVFGIFQDYYGSHEPFTSSPNIPVIGTCALGITYLGVPFAFAILKAWPKLRQWSNIGGLIVMCLAMAGASFATSINGLIATQGVLFALGGVFAWTPLLFYMPEWFVHKLAFAWGMTLGGVGIAGVALPLVIQWLLTTYGHRITLRVCALLIFVLCAPFMVFFKPRLPQTQVSTSRRPNLSFWLTPVFFVSQMCNIVESLGYFLPSLFLPSYARSLGASGFLSTLTIILLNGAGCAGNIGMGILADRLHFSTCVLISTIGTAIAVFCFWGPADSLALLYVFCVMYGLFAACWASTWPGIVREVVKKERGADGGMIFASLALGKGIGNVVSGPLSEALLKNVQGYESFPGYGGSYGMVIIFTGITAVCGGCSFAARRAGWV